eukprot:TRINITY_DN23318_c0_g1_i1.p1 TRINITY_DN23318_c0_g1~~TRINITY_DN23318_c0_g1_i1.p1  ORF type:complete len:506 (+),score=190.00 TRINITY_DN23318_c0_g1_i1:62-1579(+)
MPDDAVRRLVDQADHLRALAVDLSADPPQDVQVSPPRPWAGRARAADPLERAEQRVQALKAELHGVKQRCLEQVQEALELVHDMQAKAGGTQLLRVELGQCKAAAEQHVSALREAEAAREEAAAEIGALRAGQRQAAKAGEDRAAALEARLRETQDSLDACMERERGLARQLQTDKQKHLLKMEELEGDAAEYRAKWKRLMTGEAAWQADRRELDDALTAAQRDASHLKQRVELHRQREEDLEATVLVAQRKLQAAGDANDTLRAAADERDAVRLRAIAQLEADVRTFRTGEVFKELAELRQAVGALKKVLAEETRLRSEAENEKSRLAGALLESQGAASQAGERVKVLVAETEESRAAAEDQLAAALAESQAAHERMQQELLKQAEASEEARAATLQRYRDLIQENERLTTLVQESRALARKEQTSFLASLTEQVAVYKEELVRREAELERERLAAAEAAADRARIAEENAALKHSMKQLRHWARGVVETHDPPPLPLAVSVQF